MDLVTNEEISKLMEIYNIGKSPLSSLLGFGEATIPRYFIGQVPTKVYSDIILKAIREPKYMRELADINKDRIGDIAYNKVSKAINNILDSFSFTDNLFDVIAYLLNNIFDITALSLQKLLYYIQGIHLTLYNKPLFEEDFQAWVHGPVNRKVYNLFKNFTYNPTDDPRFIIFNKHKCNLNCETQNIIDSVINTFGNCGGRLLESITHREKPWVDARKGLDDNERSENVITKDEIKSYFDEVKNVYDLKCSAGLKEYIDSKIQKCRGLLL